MSETQGITREQLAEWEAWLVGRPEVIQRVARQLPPWKTYRVVSTGQLATILSYGEDGTVTAHVWQEWCPPLTSREVFGMSPDDFTETEVSP